MPAAILCAENDARALMARSLILSIAGYQVHTAATANDILYIFNRHKLDVLVLEHCLPAMHGGWLCQLMKEMKPDLQIVLLTDTPEELPAEFRTDVVLHKCMEPERFLGVIEEVVARRRPKLVNRSRAAAV